MLEHSAGTCWNILPERAAATLLFSVDPLSEACESLLRSGIGNQTCLSTFLDSYTGAWCEATVVPHLP